MAIISCIKLKVTIKNNLFCLYPFRWIFMRTEVTNPILNSNNFLSTDSVLLSIYVYSMKFVIPILTLPSDYATICDCSIIKVEGNKINPYFCYQTSSEAQRSNYREVLLS